MRIRITLMIRIPLNFFANPYLTFTSMRIQVRILVRMMRICDLGLQTSTAPFWASTTPSLASTALRSSCILLMLIRIQLFTLCGSGFQKNKDPQPWSVILPRYRYHFAIFGNQFFFSRIVFENESVSYFCFGKCRSCRPKRFKLLRQVFIPYCVSCRITHCERKTVMMTKQFIVISSWAGIATSQWFFLQISRHSHLPKFSLTSREKQACIVDLWASLSINKI